MGREKWVLKSCYYFLPPFKYKTFYPKYIISENGLLLRIAALVFSLSTKLMCFSRNVAFFASVWELKEVLIFLTENVHFLNQISD